MVQLLLQVLKVSLIALTIAVVATHYLLTPMPDAIAIVGSMALLAILLARSVHLFGGHTDQQS